MSDARANISEKRSFSPVWIVPIVAVLIGIWMVVYTIQSQGPEITIVFSTAEGIETGKTKIKFRDVEIGLVEEAGLGEDLESVIVRAQIDKEAAELLRQDTQFWVVRPRVGKGGISGLGTVLSGGYIQIAPGISEKPQEDFIGLEEPPVTPAGTPGLKIEIVADKTGGVGVGNPILYEGYAVGWIETETFDLETRGMRYSAFIEAPYDDLITTSSRFWNVSGISASAGADGIDIQVGSLETLVVGGVAVGTPERMAAGLPVENGMQFRLYENLAAVNERPYRYSIEYVVAFPQSVRGLLPGAPVEYRGIPVGTVERIMLRELAELGLNGQTEQGSPIPVLLRLEPARLERADSPEGVEQLRGAIATGVSRGLRATLTTGNLITGSLYVSIDFFEEAPGAEIEEYAGRPVIPSIASGLGGLEQRISALLDKVNELPLEQTVSELQQTLASLDRLIGSEGMQALPAQLGETLEQLQVTAGSFSDDSELQSRLLPAVTELQHTLSSLRQVLDTLDEQPNALIFNRNYRQDPRPPAGTP